MGKRSEFQEDTINAFIDKINNGESIDYTLENNPMIKHLVLYKVASNIAQTLLNAPFNQMDSVINQSLSSLGILTDVDRVYIFLCNDDLSKMSNTHEWCNNNVEAAIDMLQDLDTDIFPWWMKQLKLKQIINIYDVNQMSADQVGEQSILQEQNIQSVLVAPLFDKSKLIGFLGFDSVRSKKHWDAELDPLLLLCDVYTVALKRIHEESKIQSEMDIMTTLYKQSIATLSGIIEIYDPYTHIHQIRVAELAKALSLKLGYSLEKAEVIYTAGLLHDLGKIHIPSQILNKPTVLNEVETELVKQHCVLGYDIIKKIDFPWPIKDYVLQHHEKNDGSGYPVGLKGNQILREAKILCVSDIVESLQSKRIYRSDYSLASALKFINDNRKDLFDEDIVDACIDLFMKDGFVFTTKDTDIKRR
ncbi:MAG: HD domain-containing phosphohydrolase, partial [Erysipelotrichaceae bacterium]